MTVSRRSLAAFFLAALMAAAPLPAHGGEADAVAAGASSGHRVAEDADAQIALRIPMVAVGYDPAVARANGFELRRSPSGQAISVKRGHPTSSGTTVPLGTVGGDCGYSSVSLSNPSNLTYKVQTGFLVYTRAVGYSWSVQVTGPGYARTHKWGGLLRLASSWTGSATATIAPRQRGEYFAYASGSATLVNGLICRSNNPADVEAIW